MRRGKEQSSLPGSWPSLQLDHDLDRLPIVHRAIAIRHAVEICHPVEHPTRLDSAFHHIRHQFLDVSAHRSRPAGNRDVLVEADVAGWNRVVLWNADAADGSAWTSDADRGAHRLLETNALENGMRADTLRHPENLLHCGFTTLADDVRRAELLRQLDSICVTTEHDDALDAQPSRCDHPAEAYCAVA